MKVAVIGAGNMGGGLARSLVGKHEVAIGSRDEQNGAAKAKELGAASGGGYADAAADAEVIFLTVPWPAVDQTLAELGNLSGKVLVDVTNPYVGGKLRLHENSSNAEEIQRKAPQARVVKGWNTVFSPVVNTGPDFGGQAASVFLAGDDQKAKVVVSGLAADMGFDSIDCGPLSGARDLEGLMEHMGTFGQSFEWGSWALKILRR
jgi:hypothetical protein